MTFRGEIGISTVLAEIRENPGVPFHLVFLRANGREKGEFKTVAKCLYGAPGRRERTPLRSPATGKTGALHVEQGTLPCSDYDTGDYITPLISHLVSYNLLRIRH